MWVFLGRRWHSGRLWKCPQELTFRNRARGQSLFLFRRELCVWVVSRDLLQELNPFSSWFIGKDSAYRLWTLPSQLQKLISQKYRTYICFITAQCLSELNRRQPVRSFSLSNMYIDKGKKYFCLVLLLYEILLFSWNSLILPSRKYKRSV